MCGVHYAHLFCVLREEAICAHDITNAGHYEKSLWSDNDRIKYCAVTGNNLLGLDCAIIINAPLKQCDSSNLDKGVWHLFSKVKNPKSHPTPPNLLYSCNNVGTCFKSNMKTVGKYESSLPLLLITWDFDCMSLGFFLHTIKVFGSLWVSNLSLKHIFLQM